MGSACDFELGVRVVAAGGERFEECGEVADGFGVALKEGEGHGLPEAGLFAGGVLGEAGEEGFEGEEGGGFLC